MPDPEENSVYLALPYLNKEGLETYTRLLLRKMAGYVYTTTTNIADYEEEYSANPFVSVTTIDEAIEPDTVWTLQSAYGVGTGQLRVTAAGYMMYPGIDYLEIGSEGEASYQIQFKTHIDARSVVGIVIYPKQYSFGRNINVSSIVAPEAAISNSADSLIRKDAEDRLIVSKAEVQEIVNAAVPYSSFVTIEGTETVTGKKTFSAVPKIDLTASNIVNGEHSPILEAAYKANGMEYSVTPIRVLAGRATDEPYSGALMLGSSSGCTWIGSGESFYNLPMSLGSSEIDFSNDESVLVTSDSGVSVYVGCANDGSSFIKALSVDELGNADFPVALTAPTMQLNDSSRNVATTEYVRNSTISSVSDATVDSIITFRNSPVVPTPDADSDTNIAASTAFVKNVAVTLEGTQTIYGEKTFLQSLSVVNADPWLDIHTTKIQKQHENSMAAETGIHIQDGTGANLAALKYRGTPDGEATAALTVWDLNDLDPSKSVSLGVAVDPDGTRRTFAPNPSLGDSSTQIATTKFVNDTVVALASAFNEDLRLMPIYLDPEGDDSNDGYDASEPVRTFAKALETAYASSSYGGVDAYLVVKGGSYASGLQLDGVRCVVELHGDVSITENTAGKSALEAVNGASLTVKDDGSGYVFTAVKTAGAGSGVRIGDGSVLEMNCPLNVSASGSEFGIRIDGGSFARINKTLTLNCLNPVHQAVNIEGGFLRSYGLFTLKGSGIGHGVYASGSHAYVTGGLDLSQASISGVGLEAVRSTCFVLDGGASKIQGGSKAAFIESNSTLQIARCTADFKLTGSGGECVRVLRNGHLLTTEPTANVSFTFSGGASTGLIADLNSSCDFSNGSLAFNGTASISTVGAYQNSSIHIASGVAVSGTVTGRRYVASHCGLINVDGAGTERIPGNQAGTANAAQFSLYA